MTTYAAIKHGFVAQLFTPLPEWEQYPVEQLFAPGFFDEWVKIDGVTPQPEPLWRYSGGKFTPPTETDFRDYIEANDRERGVSR